MDANHFIKKPIADIINVFDNLFRENQELKKQIMALTPKPEYYYAKFYDLTWLYPGGFPDCIVREEQDNYYKIIKTHILENKHKYHDGDIIFIGSTYQTRQEYGFPYISCSTFVFGNDYLDEESMKTDGVYYSKVLIELDTFCNSYFGMGFMDGDTDELIDILKKNGRYEH